MAPPVSLPQQAQRQTQDESVVRVTVTESELSAGSKVVGSVHLLRSHFNDNNNVSTNPVRLFLRLEGREVAQVHCGYQMDHAERRQVPILHQAQHVFWESTVQWTDQHVRQKCRVHSNNNNNHDHDDDDDSIIRFNFAIPLDNHLPPSFRQDLPLPSLSRHETLSKCHIEYELQATLEQLPPPSPTNHRNTTPSDQQEYTHQISSPPCPIRVLRLIYQQPMDGRVTVQFDEIFATFLPFFCGLYEHKKESFALSIQSCSSQSKQSPSHSKQKQPAKETVAASDEIQLRWSPTQLSTVTLELTDPRRIFRPSASSLGNYRLECRLEEHWEWRAERHTIRPAVTEWILEPCMYWKGEGGGVVHLPADSSASLSPSSSSSSLIVDGEVILPVNVHESYAGQHIHIFHCAIFAVHFKSLASQEWELVGKSTKIPVLIER